MKNLEVRDIGLEKYQATWKRMQEAVNRKVGNESDELWFVEHYPVYTLGHAAEEKNIIQNNNIPVVRTDRGGQVTYHGPGQLMIYFLLNLRRLGWGPKKLICELESIMIDLLSKYGVDAKRKIGLKIKKGHCYHGISFNVDMDLKPFEGIATCGIDSLEVTQLKDLAHVSIETIKQDLVNILREYASEAA